MWHAQCIALGNSPLKHPSPVHMLHVAPPSTRPPPARPHDPAPSADQKIPAAAHRTMAASTVSQDPDAVFSRYMSLPTVRVEVLSHLPVPCSAHDDSPCPLPPSQAGKVQVRPTSASSADACWHSPSHAPGLCTGRVRLGWWQGRRLQVQEHDPGPCASLCV